MIVHEDEEKRVHICNEKDPADIHKEVFDKVVAWCIEHDAFSGETIQQSDSCVIGSLELTSEIVENVLQFDVEWFG